MKKLFYLMSLALFLSLAGGTGAAETSDESPVSALQGVPTILSLM